MCGICGALAFSDSFDVSERTVTRMRDVLTHRGPDDAGLLSRPSDGVTLGHRRLSIVDLSPAGRQPMSNEDGTVWVTFNGEIYNHEELRKELERAGHQYRSRTDTETIVHLWEQEGARCVERLHGMFGLAIWDARRRELFLARDRVGVKPVYYAELPGGFLFGSEIKALLEHPAVSADLDERAFVDYLTFAFTPPPATMYKGISKLAPAERMTVRADGTVTRDIYWEPLSPRASAEVAAMSESEMVDRVHDLMRASIRKRMMSDVPFGVFLSGGLDSSTNVALMAELSTGPVRTYSTAPKDYSKYNELRYARMIAERYETDHHEVLIDVADMEGFLPELAHHEDEPMADWTSVPQHFVTKLARETGTIVVQVGEGADEIFHGYKGYVDHRRVAIPFQRAFPQVVRRPVGEAAERLTKRLGRAIRHGEALADAGRSRVPYWGGALCFRGATKRAVLRANEYPNSYERAEWLWEDAERDLPKADVFQKMTYVELKQRLPELLLMRLDRITMANSVEGREPFLDHELVETVLALPPRMKYHRGQGKYVMRRAVEGLLPREILERKKQGFGAPMEEWLREDFGRRAQEAVRRSSLAERELLDYDEVDRLFEAHRAGRGDWSKHLWNLYSISSWHDRWVARTDRAEEAAVVT